jgi:hypothetical protein
MFGGELGAGEACLECCEDVAEGQEGAGGYEKAEGWQCVAAEAKDFPQ